MQRCEKMLLVLVSAAATLDASALISILDYGCKPNSGMNCAPAIARAMDACKARGGCTLIFPRYVKYQRHLIDRKHPVPVMFAIKYDELATSRRPAKVRSD